MPVSPARTRRASPCSTGWRRGGHGMSPTRRSWRRCAGVAPSRTNTALASDQSSTVELRPVRRSSTPGSPTTIGTTTAIRARTSTTRTADQTHAARYWAENPPATWSRVLRSLSSARGLTIDDNVKSLVEDVARIRNHPLANSSIPIYGYIYDVKSGRLVEVPEASKLGRAAASKPPGAAQDR